MSLWIVTLVSAPSLLYCFNLLLLPPDALLTALSLLSLIWSLSEGIFGLVHVLFEQRHLKEEILELQNLEHFLVSKASVCKGRKSKLLNALDIQWHGESSEVAVAEIWGWPRGENKSKCQDLLGHFSPPPPARLLWECPTEEGSACSWRNNQKGRLVCSRLKYQTLHKAMSISMFVSMAWGLGLCQPTSTVVHLSAQ